MRPFDLVFASSEEEILRFLGEGTRLIAGGTDLIPFMRAGRLAPQVLVDIGRIPSLRGIWREDGWLRVGAATTHAELVRSPLVREMVPMLAEAAGHIGSQQVRNRGTIGGNICTASPAADTVPPLLALGAMVRVVSRKGERRLPLEAFLHGPGQTALQPDEYLADVWIPLPSRRPAQAFLKIGQRNAMAISLVNGAVALSLRDGVIDHVALALGAVAPTVVRCRATEAMLCGRQLQPALLSEAAEAVRQSIRPISDVRGSCAYREYLAVVVARRLLEQAVRQASANQALTNQAMEVAP